MSFRGHSVDITNAKKMLKWHYVADTVNASASEGRILTEIKKKWSDLKVDVKKQIVLNRQSVCATGRGKGTLELTLLDEKLSGIIGEFLLSGVVMERRGTQMCKMHLITQVRNLYSLV